MTLSLYWTSWIDDAQTEYKSEELAGLGIAQVKADIPNEDVPPKNENILALWCSGVNSNCDWNVAVEDDPILFNCSKEEFIPRYGYCMVAMVLAESKLDAWEQVKKEYPYINTIGHIRFINRLPKIGKEETIKQYSRESDSRFPLNSWAKERVIKAHDKISDDISKNMVKIHWETIRMFVPSIRRWVNPNDCDLYLVVKLDAVIKLGRPLNAGIHSDAMILLEALGDEVHLSANDANYEGMACLKKGGVACIEPSDLQLPNEDWITLRILPYKKAEEKLDEAGRVVVKEILNIK